MEIKTRISPDGTITEEVEVPNGSGGYMILAANGSLREAANRFFRDADKFFQQQQAMKVIQEAEKKDTPTTDNKTVDS